MCDYVVVLAKGKLLRQGTLAEVISSADGNRLAVQVAPEELRDTTACCARSTWATCACSTAR